MQPFLQAGIPGIQLITADNVCVPDKIQVTGGTMTGLVADPKLIYMTQTSAMVDFDYSVLKVGQWLYSGGEVRQITAVNIEQVDETATVEKIRVDIASVFTVRPSGADVYYIPTKIYSYIRFLNQHASVAGKVNDITLNAGYDIVFSVQGGIDQAFVVDGSGSSILVTTMK